jgi:hypothetical protein
VEVEQIADGLWRWVVADGNGGFLASTYLEAPDAIVLVDPVLPPEGDDRDRFWRALDRDAARSGAPLHVIATRQRSAGGSAIRLRYPGTRLWPGGSFSPDDDLPGGVSAWPVNAEGGTQSLLWIPAHAALVAGSVLVGVDGGLRVETRLSRVLEALQPLTSLPVERVLVTRGEPVRTGGAAALARAIADGMSRV